MKIILSIDSCGEVLIVYKKQFAMIKQKKKELIVLKKMQKKDGLRNSRKKQKNSMKGITQQII